jgi:hypothetical protein
MAQALIEHGSNGTYIVSAHSYERQKVPGSILISEVCSKSSVAPQAAIASSRTKRDRS